MKYATGRRCLARFTLLILLTTTITSLSAQSAIQRAVDEFARDGDLNHASVGVFVLDVNSGREVASFDPDRGLTPASTQKTLTTATALAILGGDYRFTTKLEYDGQIDAQGVLQGNLYLTGGGDPTLASPTMDGVMRLDELLSRLRLAVQQAGIQRINGHIVGDGAAFGSGSDAVGASWRWLDMGNYYGAGAFGLNIHDNLYYLQFQQQDQLDENPPVAAVRPAVPGLYFINELRSAGRGTGDNAYIYGAPYTYERYIRGTIPVGSGRFTIKGSLPDPPLFAAQQLQGALESVGILAMRPPTTHRDPPQNAQPKRMLLYGHNSPPLRTIVERVNMESVNLYAEVLLRAVGLAKKGRGTADAGLDALQEYWKARGLDFDPITLEDGSGLSPQNVVTARFLAQMLRLAYREEPIRDDFYRSLPLAGRSGSLENALRSTPAEGKLRAKSGTLQHVRTFTGYAPASDGRLLAFAILVNNYSGSGGDVRRKIYDLMAALCR